MEKEWREYDIQDTEAIERYRQLPIEELERLLAEKEKEILEELKKDKK